MTDTSTPSPDRNAFNLAIIEEFRANKGVVGGPFENAPVVLLHTTGAKSGQARINPLIGQPKDDVIYIFASKGGAPTNPDWFHNILANPQVKVEFGDEVYDAVATVLEGDERDSVYAEQVKLSPQFGGYQENTARAIPVIALSRK